MTSSLSSRKQADFQVRVSKRFVILTLLACTLAALAVGRTARVLLLVHPSLTYLKEQEAILQALPSRQDVMKLPNPSLKNGKVPPSTLYTSKNFDTAKSAKIHSRWMVSEAQVPPAEITDSISENSCLTEDKNGNRYKGECSTCARSGGSPSGMSILDEQTEEEIHLPAGQHLLMDIRKVDTDFLASEERLANAMLDVVGECGLTLLSYHCHGLHPAGVSCVGVLLESHVSFHTWPAEGVITLDLFTCGPNSLLPIVPTVEKLFSVPRVGVVDLMDMPEAIYAYKLRGFGEDNQQSKAALTDLFTFPIGSMTEYKNEVASLTLAKSRIDIYDVLRSPYQTLEAYKRLLSDPTSYEAHRPLVFQPDRIVFYNGVLQTRRSSAAVLYEMFVHPIMFAHRNPRHVAVLGFEDGAIVREVLKHKSVEEVVLLDYDEVLLNMTMQYFPEYVNCTFLGNTEPSNCMDDPRVTRRFDGMETSTFDVIIVDELDFVYDAGQETDEMLRWLQKSMGSDGVLVASMGFAPERYSSAIDVDMAQNFLKRVKQAGFATVRDYEEGNLGFDNPWRFAVAFNSIESRDSWFNNEASVKLEMRKRVIQISGGILPLTFFDGAAQSSIMFPPQAGAEEFCRYNNEEMGKCSRHGFDRAPKTGAPIKILEAIHSEEGTVKLDFKAINAQ